MIGLAIAVVLFAAVHLVPAFPRLRAGLRVRFGRQYGLVFGAASAATLIAVVFAKRAAAFVPLYDPPAWGWHAALGLMLAAACCLSVFLFRGSLRQTLRLPLALATLLWGVAHLCANGDVGGVVLFGGMAVYGALQFGLGWINGVKPSPDIRGGHDLLSLFMGLAFFGIAVQLHAAVIGVPVLVLTR